MPTTILLVDDHALFRKGLRLLLEAEQDFKIVGEAGDGQEAIDRVRDLAPDVVVMDINMPNFNGIPDIVFSMMKVEAKKTISCISFNFNFLTRNSRFLPLV